MPPAFSTPPVCSWFGLVASLAIIALVVGVLAVWSRTCRSSPGRGAVEREERLLYSHIPGTPKRGSIAGGGSAGAPVPKKLSNLPA